MTRSALRSSLYVVGVAFAIGAVVLGALGIWWPTAPLGLWALILIGGLLIERWRYKPLAQRPPGPGWEATGERFVDPETGRLVTVWFHPQSGERRYVAG
jgi:hypothetical protein